MVFFYCDSGLVWLQILQKVPVIGLRLGCALTFASDAKFEIEEKISFRLEAKKA
jgi:hypothetical protein